MHVYEEAANDLHRELSGIKKSRHFVYIRALVALIMRKILRSKDVECKTEESPQVIS